MTIPVSTVPAVTAYLVTAIQAQLSTDKLPIELTVGDSGPDLPPDIVLIGEVRRNSDQMALVGSGGQFFLEEEYDIALISSTWTGSGSDSWNSTQQLALVARAWQLGAYVETACRLDPSLGGLVVVSSPSISASAGPEITYDKNENPTGVKCEVGLSLNVKATL